MMAANEQGVQGNAAGERKQRVGVFVDVENVLGWLKRGGCTELLAKAGELGVVGIRRAFGDFSNATVASRQDELQRHGFDLVHTVHPAKGKSNSADISMTIDVMESCRGPDIQWVMLATGDSDFGPVFRRLRELGKGVVGVGPSSVLSSSVALSCHEFIFTDDSSSSRRSGSTKKGRGKGGKGDRSTNTGATATWADMGGRGGGNHCAAARVATPPQLLCARGGFRFKPQPVVGEGSGGGRAAAAAVSAGGERAASYGDRGVPTSPLLIDGPAPTAAQASATKSFGAGKGPVIDWTALPSTPPPQKPSPQVDLSTAFARVALEDEAPAPAPAVTEPLLSPGQLLVPEMVTAAAAAAAASSPTVSPPPARLRGPHADVGATSTGTPSRARCPPRRTAGGVFDGSGGAAGIGGGGAAAVYGGQAHSAQNARFDSRNGSGNGGVRGHGWRAGASTPPPPPPSLPPAFGGLGALSVIRPSEKLYMHLLSVEYSPSAAADRTGDTAGSLASDWGSGLSEVTLAKGLVSLAEACGGQGGGDNSRAAAAAAAAAALGGGGGGGGGGAGVALDREEAFRVANLLQRCGFLSWVAKEQQWLVTVPADVEVLRRRRDETMMEELLTRCQEAGVPFEPTLAANLLWSKARR